MRDLNWINGSQMTRSEKRMRDQRKKSSDRSSKWGFRCRKRVQRDGKNENGKEKEKNKDGG